MSEVAKIWFLNDPKQAREYLGTLVVNGYGKITNVTLESGTVLEFSDMTDEQACHYAKDLAKMFGVKELHS